MAEKDHNADGTFAKGNTLGSKSKRRDSFVKQIRAKTNNLLSLLEDYLELKNDPNTSAETKRKMIEWLIEGDLGKATTYLEAKVEKTDSMEKALQKVDDREAKKDNGDS